MAAVYPPPRLTARLRDDAAATYGAVHLAEELSWGTGSTPRTLGGHLLSKNLTPNVRVRFDRISNLLKDNDTLVWHKYCINSS
jgi:hypothetical protein